MFVLKSGHKNTATHLKYWDCGVFSPKLTTGIEPVTSSLPMRCATNCATSANCILLICNINNIQYKTSHCQYVFLLFFLATKNKSIPATPYHNKNDCINGAILPKLVFHAFGNNSTTLVVGNNSAINLTAFGN